MEPGDRVVVGECGRFGLLLIEIAERCGAEVVPVRGEWGRALEPDAIAAALRGKPPQWSRLSTARRPPACSSRSAEIARLAHAHDALVMADAVVTLGGCEVAVGPAGAST